MLHFFKFIIRTPDSRMHCRPQTDPN